MTESDRSQDRTHKSSKAKVKDKAQNLKQFLQEHVFPVKLKKFLLSRDETNLDAVHVLTSQKNPIFILKTGAKRSKRLCPVPVLT